MVHVGLSTARLAVLATAYIPLKPVLLHRGPLNTLLGSLGSGRSGPASRLVHLEAGSKEANLMSFSGSLFGHLILIKHVRLNLKSI